MPNIYYLEGLPGVGKTRAIRLLGSNFHTVNELLSTPSAEQYNADDQGFYLDNDRRKTNPAITDNKQPALIDRGPLSTLAYNLTRDIIRNETNSIKVLNEYSKRYAAKYSSGEYRVILLKTDSYTLPYSDTSDPFGSIDNQKLLENVYSKLIDSFVLTSKTVVNDLISDSYLEEILHEVTD